MKGLCFDILLIQQIFEIIGIHFLYLLFYL